MKSCLICGSPEVDRAHVKTRGSGGSDDAFNIMYLCRKSHQEQHRIGILTFIKKYPQVEQWLLENGWEITPTGLFHEKSKEAK